MPRLPIEAHELRHAAIASDDNVRAGARSRIRQPVDGALGIRASRVVDDDEPRLETRALIRTAPIGKRCPIILNESMP